MILEKILGVLKGKEGFARSDRNFTKIENEVNSLGEQINSLDAEVVAHKAEKATSTKLGHVYGFRGVLLRKSSAQSIPNSQNTPINFQLVSYQEGFTFWSGTEPSKIVIPTGVSKIVLKANLSFASNSTGIRGIQFRVNGIVPAGYPNTQYATVNGSDTRISLVSAVVNVNEGDEIDIVANQNSGGSLDLLGGFWWASLEVVD